MSAFDDFVLSCDDGAPLRGNISSTYNWDRAPIAMACNLLLVRMSKRGFYERVAVGQIHELAWIEASPLKKKIILRKMRPSTMTRTSNLFPPSDSLSMGINGFVDVLVNCMPKADPPCPLSPSSRVIARGSFPSI